MLRFVHESVSGKSDLRRVDIPDQHAFTDQHQRTGQQNAAVGASPRARKLERFRQIPREVKVGSELPRRVQSDVRIGETRVGIDVGFQ